MDEDYLIPEKSSVPYDWVKKTEGLGLKQTGWEELKHVLVNDRERGSHVDALHLISNACSSSFHAGYGI